VGRLQTEFERVALPQTANLLRFARRLTPQNSDAEDLVQETLLSAWRGFSKFQKGTDIRAWLFRILINAHHGRLRTLVVEPPMEQLEQQMAVAATSHTERLGIERALAALPPTQRAVLLLQAVEGFTCREISEILFVPIGTVMSRLSRAREAMRYQLLTIVRRYRVSSEAGTLARKTSLR